MRELKGLVGLRGLGFRARRGLFAGFHTAAAVVKYDDLLPELFKWSKGPPTMVMRVWQQYKSSLK